MANGKEQMANGRCGGSEVAGAVRGATFEFCHLPFAT
jgi:hypothetical protein